MNYSIKYVSTVTGLSEHRIRAWEKRYKLLTPNRSAKGRRLYDDQDIHKLKLVSTLIDRGAKVGELAKLNSSQLEERVGQTATVSLKGRKLTQDEVTLKKFILKQSLVDKRYDLFQHEVTRSQEVSPLSYLDDFILPLVKDLSDTYRARKSTAYDLALNFIQDQLRTLFYEVDQLGQYSSSEPLIVASLDEEGPYELESWVCALKLTLDGNKVLHIGKIQSAEILVELAKSLRPTKIVISDKVDRPGKEWKHEQKLHTAFQQSWQRPEAHDLEILVLLQGLSKPLHCPYFHHNTRTLAFDNLESISGHLKKTPDSVDWIFPTSA